MITPVSSKNTYNGARDYPAIGSNHFQFGQDWTVGEVA